MGAPSHDQLAVSTDQPVSPDAPGTRRRHPALGDVVAVLGVYLALGLIAGVVWWLLYDPAVYTVGRGGGLGMGEAELGKRFHADAWYAVVAGALGLVSGTALTWWRGRDPLLTSLLVLVGSSVAAAAMAVLGGWLGPPDPATVRAAVGEAVPMSLEVDAPACYLVWPVTALIGALIVLWSPPPVDQV